MESKSVEDICEWLAEKNFSESLVESFRGEYIIGVFLITIIIAIKPVEHAVEGIISCL